MFRSNRFGMRACAASLVGAFALTVSLLAGSAFGDTAPSPGTGHEGDPGVCVGDVVPDGRVNVADLIVVLASWGECPGCPGDVNGDGWVDVSDLLLVMSHWGSCDG